MSEVLGHAAMGAKIGLDLDLVDVGQLRPHMSTVRFRDGEELLYLRTSIDALHRAHAPIFSAASKASRRRRALEIRVMRSSGTSWGRIASTLDTTVPGVFAMLSWERR